MRKHGLDEALLLLAALVLFAAALVLPMALALAESGEEAQLLKAMETGELIRLHVIANSDCPKDQQIKLAVRDRIIDVFGQTLCAEASSDAVYEKLLQNVDAMRETALHTAQEHGFSGNVMAEVGRMHLPAKTYGTVTLPEGEYRALRITLGNGEGKNWWCVLFPQLCLALSEDGTAEPKVMWDSKRILEQWLVFAN